MKKMLVCRDWGLLLLQLNMRRRINNEVSLLVLRLQRPSLGRNEMTRVCDGCGFLKLKCSSKTCIWTECVGSAVVEWMCVGCIWQLMEACN